MNEKYSIMARNFDNKTWLFEVKTNSIIKTIFCLIKAIFKYEIVDFCIRK